MAIVTSPAAADGNSAQAKSEVEVQALLQELGVQPLVKAKAVATHQKRALQKRHYSSKHLFSTDTARYYLMQHE